MSNITTISPHADRARRYAADLRAQNLVRLGRTDAGTPRYDIFETALIQLSGAEINGRTAHELGFEDIPHEPYWFRIACPEGLPSVVARLLARDTRRAA